MIVYALEWLLRVGAQIAATHPGGKEDDWNALRPEGKQLLLRPLFGHMAASSALTFHRCT